MNIIRRNDYTINVTCKNSDDTAINITGYSVFFTVKRNVNDTDAEALISKKVTSHTNPTAGLTAVVLTNTDTDIDEGDYVYDFQLVNGSGLVSSSQRDIFTVQQDVTIRTT